MDSNYSFENNNTLQKSKNHIITWKKKSNINTCDLNSNCIKLEIDITTKNNNINTNEPNPNSNKLDIDITDNLDIIDNLDKIRNNDLLINSLQINTLPTGNLKVYESFSIINNNDNIILFILVIMLLFILLYKKNNFRFN